MAKVAVFVPAGTVTLDGIVIWNEVVPSLTAVPPAGAGLESVNVPLEDWLE